MNSPRAQKILAKIYSALKPVKETFINLRFEFSVTQRLNLARLTITLIMLFSATVKASTFFDDPLRSAVPPPDMLRLAPDSPPCVFTDKTAWSVVEVIERALCGNPKTREAWANAKVQAAQVGSAQGAYLPTLTGRVTDNRYYDGEDQLRQRNASLNFSWLLYDFGARSANLESAQHLLSAAAFTLDATVQNVFLSALQAYYNAQAARSAVQAAEQSEKASRESLLAAETRYRVGNGTPADRLQAQTAWSQAQLNRIKAEGLAQNTLGTLANIMGLDANTALPLDAPSDTLPSAKFTQDIEALIAQARTTRPDFKAAEAQLKAVQSDVHSARASGLPTLSLSTTPTWDTRSRTGDNLSTHSGAIALTLNIPIFSGFDTLYKTRSALARVEVAKAQRDNLHLQIALDVWNAYQNLNTATQSVRSASDLLASAEQSERVALGRYKAGVGTILDVLNAQSALASARLQNIQALLDWHVSRATLARTLGILDAQTIRTH